MAIPAAALLGYGARFGLRNGLRHLTGVSGRASWTRRRGFEGGLDFEITPLNTLGPGFVVYSNESHPRKAPTQRGRKRNRK